MYLFIYISLAYSEDFAREESQRSALEVIFASVSLWNQPQCHPFCCNCFLPACGSTRLNHAAVAAPSIMECVFARVISPQSQLLAPDTHNKSPQ